MVMGTQAVSTYQQVIEKTKGLAFRSQMLVMNLDKKLAPKQENVVCIQCLNFALTHWFKIYSVTLRSAVSVVSQTIFNKMHSERAKRSTRCDQSHKCYKV